MHSPLSFRQQRFVIEYLRDRDALAAAGRAGFAVSARAAAARRMMGNPAVRGRLEAEMRRLAAQVERLAVRENWVLLRALAGLGGEGSGGLPEIGQVLSGWGSAGPEWIFAKNVSGLLSSPPPARVGGVAG
jgi:hypothetical protein